MVQNKNVLEIDVEKDDGIIFCKNVFLNKDYPFKERSRKKSPFSMHTA